MNSHEIQKMRQLKIRKKTFKTGRMINVKKRTLHTLAITTVLLFSLLAGFQAVCAEKDETANAGPTINIFDEISDYFDTQQRPAVQFPHDLHTDALKDAKADQLCTECHRVKDNKLLQKFMRTEDQNSDILTNLCHDNCIGCHKEMAARNEQTGPQECGLCHVSDQSDHLPEAVPVFDRSLHYRHEKANENRCELCHHQYDEKQKRLFYEKGTEGSCRYCHKEIAENNVQALKSAFHSQCLACHLEKRQQTDKKLPFTCRDCHTHKKLDAIEKIATPARIQRNQPDFVVIKKGKSPLKYRMDYAPFDHLTHETATATCRKCHHQSMASCAECHLVGLPEKREDISLEQAMHTRQDDFSCIGCHAARQKEKECAGCHASMYMTSLATKGTDDGSCRNCHTLPSGENTPQSQTEMKAFFQSRTAPTERFDKEAVPEKVVIDTLTDQYKEAVMPHRKIIDALNNGINASKMAQFFHENKFTTCKGCHHEVPGTLHPPKCAHCHFSNTIKSENDRVSLVAAYHNQCIGCHKVMEIEMNGCVDCHKEKK